MKKIMIFIIVFVSSFLLGIVGFKIIASTMNKEDSVREEDINKSIKASDELKFSKYIITEKESFLYKKDNGKYSKVGKVNKDVNLILSDTKPKSNTKYYKIENLDYYVYYNDVNSIEEFSINDRYKNYIPFNKNIKTKNPTVVYDENDNYIYSIDESFDFKVLVIENGKYGVEFNNQLVYIHNDSVESVYDNDNGESNKDKIRTLNYHFIYNPQKKECGESICHTLEQFESELKYLNENNYFTMKLNELEMYLDGKINIPEKSIVLTIDDGTVFDLEAITLLEKYKVNLTMFVITSFVGNISELKSDYLDLESHTHNMHNQYECPGYGMQGGGILCLPEEQVLNDLKTSQDILGGSKYFAYPFFDFNDRAIKLLKTAGFKLAFIGQYDTEGYSYKGKTDHYKLRRMGIFSNTDLNEFISYLDS